MKITRTILGREIAIELTAEEVRKIYYETDREYLREDVRQWLEAAEKEFDDKLVEEILDELCENYDDNLSHWDNIRSAYDWHRILLEG